MRCHPYFGGWGPQPIGLRCYFQPSGGFWWSRYWMWATSMWSMCSSTLSSLPWDAVSAYSLPIPLWQASGDQWNIDLDLTKALNTVKVDLSLWLLCLVEAPSATLNFLSSVGISSSNLLTSRRKIAASDSTLSRTSLEEASHPKREGFPCVFVTAFFFFKAFGPYQVVFRIYSWQCLREPNVVMVTREWTRVTSKQGYTELAPRQIWL